LFYSYIFIFVVDYNRGVEQEICSSNHC